jgi:hypothetical protein
MSRVNLGKFPQQASIVTATGQNVPFGKEKQGHFLSG